MCLPGVRVEVREKDNPELIICHFSIDWMTAQVRHVLGKVTMCEGIEVTKDNGYSLRNKVIGDFSN